MQMTNYCTKSTELCFVLSFYPNILYLFQPIYKEKYKINLGFNEINEDGNVGLLTSGIPLPLTELMVVKSNPPSH